MCLISIELQLINDLERECPPETPGRRTKIALARLLFIQGFFLFLKGKVLLENVASVAAAAAAGIPNPPLLRCIPLVTLLTILGAQQLGGQVDGIRKKPEAKRRFDCYCIRVSRHTHKVLKKGHSRHVSVQVEKKERNEIEFCYCLVFFSVATVSEKEKSLPQSRSQRPEGTTLVISVAKEMNWGRGHLATVETARHTGGAEIETTSRLLLPLARLATRVIWWRYIYKKKTSPVSYSANRCPFQQLDWSSLMTAWKGVPGWAQTASGRLE